MLYLLSFSLTSYVYAVGKQPTGNMWCKMVERGGATVKCGDGFTATRFVKHMYYFMHIETTLVYISYVI